MGSWGSWRRRLGSLEGRPGGPAGATLEVRLAGDPTSGPAFYRVRAVLRGIKDEEFAAALFPATPTDRAERLEALRAVMEDHGLTEDLVERAVGEHSPVLRRVPLEDRSKALFRPVVLARREGVQRAAGVRQ